MMLWRLQTQQSEGHNNYSRHIEKKHKLFSPLMQVVITQLLR